MIRRDTFSGEVAGLIVQGMLEKKGLKIITLDLRKIHNSVVDYFIICHATSTTHADTLAESVEETVKKSTGQNPRQREGMQLREWILIDYFDVVAHIFLEPVRSFYRLEELWADAEKEEITEQYGKE